MAEPKVKFSEFGGENDPPYSQQQIDQICARLDTLKEPVFIRPPDTKLQVFKWITLLLCGAALGLFALSHRYATTSQIVTIQNHQWMVAIKVDNLTGTTSFCRIGDPLEDTYSPLPSPWVNMSVK